LNLILIDGTEDTLLGLQDIPDMILEFGSARALPSGQVRVAAYATDRAITEIETRGATVGMVVNNQDLQARLDDLFQKIDGGGTGVG